MFVYDCLWLRRQALSILVSWAFPELLAEAHCAIVSFVKSFCVYDLQKLPGDEVETNPE